MNEPQLSAEMKKRFSKIMLEWIESQWKIEQAHQNGEPYTRMKFEADANEVENRLKHFLATALEEERAKVLSEVEELKQIPDEIPEPVLEPHDEYNWDWRVCKLCGEKNIGDRAYLEHMRRKHGLSKKTTSKYYNQALDDVLAKLNQLKEEG